MLKLEVYARKNSVVYATEKVSRNVCLAILAKNQIFLNEARWDENRK